jgi:cell division protein FtsI (penicillin-binding protein 3)
MVKMKSRNELAKNIRFIAVGFMVLFAVAALRAYFLQVLRSGELTGLIQSQYMTSVELMPYRGTVYDRNGAELAASLDVESLYARPGVIRDPKAAARLLAPILELPLHAVYRDLASTKPFVWLQRKVTPAQAEQIRALKIEGVGFLKESQRFYPQKELAAQVLGFVGVDSQGLEGIERQYDSIIKGKSHKLFADRDAKGRNVFVEGLQPSDQSRQGNDLVLSIDKNIQYIAEKELQAAVALSQAKGGTAIVMDPWTGEVLASAVYPQFNPNQYAESARESWRNRAVSDIYEPGSTFKTFLVASALEEGIIKPSDMFFCENGAYRVASRIIHDHGSYGWLDVANIIKHSSNIGASKIGRQLGKEQMYSYIRRFGFTAETGISLPAEQSGFMPPLKNCSEHTQSAISFGQSITVTPLQMVTAYCAIANGGMLMQPQIVRRIVDSTGAVVRQSGPVMRHRVISEQTAGVMRTMLKQVVGPGGTGTRAAVEGYTVAGKTGTSQKIEQGAYSHSKVIASFAGFVPADNPRLTIIVLIDEPQRMKYGGEIAAPAFSRMSDAMLNYLHVPPEPMPAQEPGILKEIQTEPIKLAKLDEA